MSSSDGSLTAQSQRSTAETLLQHQQLISVSSPSQEHVSALAAGTGARLLTPLNLWLFPGAPPSSPGGGRSSRACLVNEERSRGAGLDADPPRQSWTSDDPSPLLLTLHCARQPAEGSAPMLARRPAATQTHTHTR